MKSSSKKLQKVNSKLLPKEIRSLFKLIDNFQFNKMAKSDKRELERIRQAQAIVTAYYKNNKSLTTKKRMN